MQDQDRQNAHVRSVLKIIVMKIFANSLDQDQDQLNAHVRSVLKIIVMKIFANSLDQDQDRLNVGPDLGPNC